MKLINGILQLIFDLLQKNVIVVDQREVQST